MSLQLQLRDHALLRGLFESRIMTSRQAAKLFFQNKAEYTKKRLQKLKAAGLIGERKRHVTQASVLYLTRKAFSLLAESGQLTGLPEMNACTFERRANVSERTLQHELDVMDVKVAFHTELNVNSNFSLLQFKTWPLLYEFQISRPGQGADFLVKPDGFVQIHEKESGTRGFIHDCFVEVDRSSEVLDILTNKAAYYLEYYKSGEFAVRNGGSRTQPKEFPFRVLMILKSAERRNNVAERLIQNIPPVLTQTWLTTFEEVIANPLGNIWMLPADYREAVKGTHFQNASPDRRFVYRRQAERDAFVQAKATKRSIFQEVATSEVSANAVSTNLTNGTS